MQYKSNLTERNDKIETLVNHGSNVPVATKGRLASLVDKQLESRGICTSSFTEAEKQLNYDRELLGNKFYQKVLTESGIDFWNVFRYASFHLCDGQRANVLAKQPEEVQRIFEILTGEKEFVKAAQVFFMEVIPINESVQNAFIACGWETKWLQSMRGLQSLSDLKTYFALELSEEKINKLEILMEDCNAEKTQRFKLNDQYAERQLNNMETVSRLLEKFGKDAQGMIVPLILNELCVNPRDIFRYYYHQDLCRGLILAGTLGTHYCAASILGRLPEHKSIMFEKCMELLGIKRTDDSGSPKYGFWKELQELLKTPIATDYNSITYPFPYYIFETGYRGSNEEKFDYQSTPFCKFLNGYVYENPMCVISSYGAEATKDRLEAIFTEEVMEVLLEDYGFLTLSDWEIASRLKVLRRNRSSEEVPKKKGLFGLFRKGKQ